jgi:hypothetical protein
VRRLESRRLALLFWGALPAGWSAGARPVECQALPNIRSSFVSPPAFATSWGRCPQTPALPRAMPAAPSAGARPGALRSRTRGWLRLYSPPSEFFESQVPTPRPRNPSFRCARLVLQAARYAGNETIGRWGLPPPYPRFPLRSAYLSDGSLPRAIVMLGLSCRRLATAGNEALGSLAGGGCRPHNPAYRCARLVLQTDRCRNERDYGGRVEFLASVKE